MSHKYHLSNSMNTVSSMWNYGLYVKIQVWEILQCGTGCPPLIFIYVRPWRGNGPQPLVTLSAECKKCLWGQSTRSPTPQEASSLPQEESLSSGWIFYSLYCNTDLIHLYADSIAKGKKKIYSCCRHLVNAVHLLSQNLLLHSGTSYVIFTETWNFQQMNHILVYTIIHKCLFNLKWKFHFFISRMNTSMK